MKRLLFLLMSFLLITALPAQTNKKIKQLESKRSVLQKEISKKESLLKTTKKDVGSQLRSLNTLTGQIEDRKRYIKVIEGDVQSIDQEVTSLSQQLRNLELDLLDKKRKYASSVQYLYKNKTIEEKLMFIFSAKSLSETYRRLRYVREYATYQRIQGQEILKRQAQIGTKKNEVEQVKVAKVNLLSQGEQEKKRLEEQEQQKKVMVSDLQKKQKGLQSEIAKHRREANQLNAQIDRLINIEIEKARKRAEERARKEAAAAEARRKAEAAAEARRKAEAAEEARRRAASESKSERTEKSSRVAKAEKPEKVEKVETREREKVAPAPVFSMDSSDRQLSDNFERNRGSLPSPITGPHLIVSHYGQYAVEGLRNVKLDNKGIDIQGQPGALARSIFNGEVAVVFQVNGLMNVIIRHGSYISVYCNLSSASVSKGQKVSTRQTIGRVYSDPSDGDRTILHFQLRKETSKLNPEAWISR
ncbi:Septal ring factor EnvC, activator of murein hydrolases AmiA and AmiB [Bacteroides luti]|uniref:Septal ring factor EnvC, activator of murein hydrolases AmiA and AmiB n=1 Tax=Bacteroides luti TaxID=1297750 RepID=A0A1M4ZBJ3_9BACE|nr:peptidoglycan DD-metalloendopeptidase family protein [Bacteroides luti]SHF15410.1 Septal ring factor EnvC, activator of murein hydrolases AmiA and AmiB [Bacteroides luti]